jgi:hypothetical protein
MRYLNWGTPEDNRYRYCPYCGQRLTMRPPDRGGLWLKMSYSESGCTTHTTRTGTKNR